MNKGYYLRRSEAIYALGTTPAKWNTMQNQFKRTLDNKGKKIFWIPEDKVTEEYRKANISYQYSQQPDQILQQLEENVDFQQQLEDSELQAVNLQLKKARKQNILTQTKYLEQKLQHKKQQLFYEWSNKFFECFTTHFSRFRNDLIQLHLQQEEIDKLNQSLDVCFGNMKLNLNQIWDSFMNKKEEGIQTNE